MIAAGASTPALSVVLAAPDGWGPIRTTVEHLARQTLRGGIELVLVVPSAATLVGDAGTLDAFARCTIVETGSIVSIGSANAAGARRAVAPVVAFGEDHAFPEPDWAQRLVAAHAGDWVAVGPVLTNANPATAVSRADFLIAYGPWIAPAVTGEVDHLPGHNSSYKREALVALGDALAPLLEAETLLHWRLREHGHRLLLDASARIAHVNFSRWRPWLAVQFHAGRTFAGSRARGMSRARQVLFCAGSPLIPLLRLARIARVIWRSGERRAYAGSLHALLIGLTLDGLGQAFGYAAGTGGSGHALARYEFLRARHLSPRDFADPRLARYASTVAR